MVASECAHVRQIGSGQLLPFLLIAFGLAWSLFALFLFATDWVVGAFGELSGSHPLFILAVYSPAIAALTLVGYSAGLAGIGKFLTRLFLWRASPWWYGFLLIGFPVISRTYQSDALAWRLCDGRPGLRQADASGA